MSRLLRYPRPRTSAAAAYRRDLQYVSPEAHATESGTWITVGGLLAQGATVAGEEGSRLVGEALRLARQVLHPGASAAPRPFDVALDDRDGDAQTLRLLVALLEDGGFVHLAAQILDASVAAGVPASDVERGRALAHRARLCWKMGESTLAARYYKQVERAAVLLQSDELLVRAWIGYVALSQMRGNYPSMRTWATKAAAVAEERGFARLAGAAHHALLVVHAKSAEFDQALVHGWLSYANVIGDPTAEREALLNVGHLLLDVGEANAARAAFSAVLDARVPERLALPAAGGMARAAAGLGDHDTVYRLADRIETRATSAVTRYAAASALFECANACRACGNTERAQRLAEASMAIAKANDFHELVMAYERSASEPASAPVRLPLSDQAQRVIENVLALNPGPIREVLFAS